MGSYRCLMRALLSKVEHSPFDGIETGNLFCVHKLDVNCHKPYGLLMHALLCYFLI